MQQNPKIGQVVGAIGAALCAGDWMQRGMPARFKGYDITQFQGMLAPARTDPAIVDRLYGELQKIGKAPYVVKRLGEDGGNELIMNSPKEFANLIRSELLMYGKLIKDAGITAD